MLKRHIALALVLVLSLAFGGVAMAASVIPTVIEGADNTNKTCAAVMPGTYELKYDFDGGKWSDTGGGQLVANFVKPSTLPGSPNSFDWTSNIAVLGVIVKDGVDGANWYDYGAFGSKGDTYLTTPFDGGKGISHISFCYVPPMYQPLKVTKTAVGTYDRTVTWTLEKSVDPTSHVGKAGEVAGSSTWSVVATKTEKKDNYKVIGTITIENQNAIPVAFSVSDSLDDGTLATVTCPSGSNIVTASSTLICSYEATPEGATATKNTAVVTSLTPGVDGATAEATFAFAENLKGFDSGTLSDARFGFSEVIDATATKTFDETFTCPNDASKYKEGVYEFFEVNTAYLNGNLKLEASARVDVKCLLPALQVKKNAAGSYDRTVTWELEKSVAPTNHEGKAGEVAGSSVWTVIATKSQAEGNYKVTGKIAILNPASIPQTFTVSDKLNDGTVAGVSCPSNIAPAGGQVVCDYEASPTSKAATKNTVVVSAAGNPDQTATAEVEFIENLKGFDSGTLSDARFGFSAVIDATTTKVFPEDFYCPADRKLYVNGKYEFTELNEACLNDQIDRTAEAEVKVTCELKEWCSPGYWRQPQHLGSWDATGIKPTELYSHYFGLPERTNQGIRQKAPTDPTLLQVLQKPQWYGGDAFNKVGDLLSDAHPDVWFTGERIEDSCPLGRADALSSGLDAEEASSFIFLPTVTR